MEGVTHRRMRQSLMESFDSIYALDLHGNVKKQEKSPEGSKDENIFDIQQGVAVSLFIKQATKEKLAKVHYAEMWGLQKNKDQCLLDSCLSSTKWKSLAPQPGFFFFVPKNFDLQAEYSAYSGLKDIFLISGSGIKTERDKVTIHWNTNGIKVAIDDFNQLHESDIKKKIF